MAVKSSDKLLRAAMDGDAKFGEVLRSIVKDILRIDLGEFADRARISGSTLYKIVSEGRAPNLRTLRAIVNAVDDIEGKAKGEFIAIIAARSVLDRIEERTILIDNKQTNVREYPASTIEDVIVAAIRAEEEGAKGIVCAPIVSSTVERVVNVPIVTISPKDSVLEAIRVAAKKASL